VICEYLAKECSEGCVLGLLDPVQFPSIQVGHLGVVPKHTPDQWRLIVGMSSLEGSSANNDIPESLCFLSYITIQGAAQEHESGVPPCKSGHKKCLQDCPSPSQLMGMLW